MENKSVPKDLFPAHEARQYYYRKTDCIAVTINDANCICWHDEGTGPLADRPEEAYRWRKKPVPIDKDAPEEFYTALERELKQKQPNDSVFVKTLILDALIKYFGERPQIDTMDRRVVFEAGFVRGYQKGAGGTRQSVQLDLDAAVSRFLGWKLPDDFAPDCYVSFDRERIMQYANLWPVGTNLLNAIQAKDMLAYCLQDSLFGCITVPEGYKLLKDSTIEERSWSEDAEHENGNYYNTCACCQRQFVGYKRRAHCKVCSTEPNDGEQVSDCK